MMSRSQPCSTATWGRKTARRPSLVMRTPCLPTSMSWNEEIVRIGESTDTSSSSASSSVISRGGNRGSRDAHHRRLDDGVDQRLPGFDDAHAGAEPTHLSGSAAGVVEGHKGAGGHEEAVVVPVPGKPGRHARVVGQSGLQGGASEGEQLAAVLGREFDRSRLGLVAPRPPATAVGDGNVGHREIVAPGDLAGGRHIEHSTLSHRRRGRAGR